MRLSLRYHRDFESLQVVAFWQLSVRPRTQREGRRKLPIGIQTFRRVREEGCYYVDKTGFAVRLVEEGSRYFLPRPRRFGKSLFVDTLKELFEGSRELFQGLAAEEGWDWSLRCPVLRLDFSGANCQEPGRLEATSKVRSNASHAGPASPWGTLPVLEEAVRRRGTSHAGPASPWGTRPDRNGSAA